MKMFRILLALQDTTFSVHTVGLDSYSNNHFILHYAQVCPIQTGYFIVKAENICLLFSVFGYKTEYAMYFMYFA